MHTYNVYRQYFPITAAPADPRLGIDAVYEAAVKLQGEVQAEDAEDAMEQARLRFGLHAPIVQLVH